VYPQLPGSQSQQPYRQPYSGASNQQPGYNHTTVVVQPSPTYAGGYGGGGGGYGGYRSGGSSLAGVGLGLAGGALLGSK